MTAWPPLHPPDDDLARLLGAAAPPAVAPARVAVTDATQIGEARRAAVAVAAAVGLDETARGRVALLATEAATNLARHAVDGVLVVQAAAAGADAGSLLAPGIPGLAGARLGVEILAVDGGPGMDDPSRCLRDGYSTGGTAGEGLGALGRVADAFDLDTHPGRGTTLVARVWAGRAPSSAGAWSAPSGDDDGLCVGAVSLPIAGETVNGDAWASRPAGAPGARTFLVVDGLGHGPVAAEVARSAVALFRAAPEGLTPVAHLQRLHRALRATRGAAVAVATVDAGAERVHFAGVGNVAARLLTPSVDPEHPDGIATRSFVSHNGIVGHQMRTPQEFVHPWDARTTLVLATDGLKTHWTLDGLPGLAARDPGILAATLWRDARRGRDDETVLVVRALARGTGA